jgi:DNA-binding NarL/FixJ family response regulator
VLIADDQTVVREGLETLLSLSPGIDGEALLDPVVQRRLIEQIHHSGPRRTSPERPERSLPDGLTQREAEVLGLIAEGLSNAEIARRLVISEATIKTRINNSFSKAELRDRAQAVVYAIRHGLAGEEQAGRRMTP